MPPYAARERVRGLIGEQRRKMHSQAKRYRRGTAIARLMGQREQIGARRNADLAMSHAARIRDVEALMASVFTTSYDAILIVGPDDRVEMTNAAAADLFGDTDLSLRQLPIDRLIPDLKNSRHDGRYYEAVARRIDGSRISVEHAVTVVGMNDHIAQVVVLRDISERKSHEDVLRHQATHDPLTGLPNRALLVKLVQDKLNAAVDGQAFALLLLDLDRFKEINDTLGHDIGDDLLCRLADRLRIKATGLGTIARLGGDEFALLIDPVADRESAESAATALADCIEVPFVLRDLSLAVEASVGIALYPDHASSVKDLLRHADVAMYTAKQHHSRIATYDATADRNSIRHLTLTGELKRAVDNAVMELEYQPKLSLTAGRPFSAEALLRWTHPNLGRVPPTEFIPQAEKTGLIGPLTTQTLVSAVRQMAVWDKTGLTLSVAVNLSAQVIHDGQLPGLIDGLLRQHGVDPDRLTLELTESAIMYDPEGALQVAHQIAEIGVRLSIDDFGTGYSSLAYLSRLPVRELKIDRSFVSRMLISPTDATIVRSTIDLAHSLGMSVVGEGIDQIGILRRLVALGCDYGQGFLIAYPTPPAEVGQVILDAVRIAKQDWNIGLGGDDADIRTLQDAAATEVRRVAGAAD